ncbi:MAG TPA: hypothetical protein VII01_07335 [Solirubrobacteraceae bacterium]|jgi:hypothetical protein
MPDFFDGVIDEIMRSAAGDESPHPSQGRTLPAPPRLSALRRSGLRRGLVGIALLSLLGTVGGLALAGTFSGQTVSPQEWVEGKRVQPEAGLTASQTANLGILRRPRGPADALPATPAASVTQSPMAASGVNLSLSRRVSGIGSGAAWVIPGNNTICLIADNAQALAMASRYPSATSRVPGASGVTSCAPTSSAAKGWSAGTSGTSESRTTVFTAGIVPDGVNSVTISVDGGQPILLPVHENVYAAEVQGWPSLVSFTTPAGQVSLSNGPDVLSRVAAHR